LCVFTSGCGRGLRLVPVTGSLTLDGKPVSNASVLFVRVDEGPAAFGVTDSQGRFELYTVNRRGAALGSYRVAVTLEQSVALPGTVGIDEIAPAAESLPAARLAIPEKFLSPDTSGLTAEVAEGRQHFDFALRSGEKTPSP